MGKKKTKTLAPFTNSRRAGAKGGNPSGLILGSGNKTGVVKKPKAKWTGGWKGPTSVIQKKRLRRGLGPGVKGGFKTWWAARGGRNFLEVNFKGTERAGKGLGSRGGEDI